MEGVFILLVPFVAAFAATLLVTQVMYRNSKQQRRIESILWNKGYRNVEKVNRFQKLGEKKKIGISSENMAYVYSGLVAATLWLYLNMTMRGTFSSELEPLVQLLPFAVFILVPFFFKRFITMQRTQEILRTLPILIDLMIICLESGLSFTMAIDKVLVELQNKSKFLAKRLQQMVHELNAGVEKKAALNALVERCYNHPDVKTFVTSIIQSESLGFSIVQTLRVQADEVRDKRRQFLRTQIAKMPVKLLFPLVFCIFPVTCILLVGPGFIQVLKALQ